MVRINKVQAVILLSIKVSTWVILCRLLCQLPTHGIWYCPHFEHDSRYPPGTELGLFMIQMSRGQTFLSSSFPMLFSLLLSGQIIAPELASVDTSGLGVSGCGRSLMLTLFFLWTCVVSIDWSVRVWPEADAHHLLPLNLLLSTWSVRVCSVADAHHLLPLNLLP